MNGFSCSYAEAIRIHGAERGGEVALVTASRTLCWAELDRRSEQLARALLAGGAAYGRLVGICLPNEAECVVAVIACWKIGAIPNVLPAQLSAPEFRALLAVADPALLVGEPPVASSLPCIRDPFAAGSGFSAEPLPDSVSPYCRATCSGGSTGTPKIVVDHTEARCNPRAALYTVEPGSVTLIPGPLYHSGPFLNCFWTLLGGGRVILMERFDAATALGLIQQHRPVYTGLVPTMMLRIWRLPEALRDSFDLSSLRRVVSSGAACPAWLMRAWIEWLGPERMVEAYGASERVGGTLITGAEWLRHPGSVGKPTLGRQIRILDRAGQPLPAGEVGQIHLRSDAQGSASFHYLGAQPEHDAEGWVTLGDLGYLDAEGYLYITDRKADMIVSGGANVYPAEVEAAVEAHPEVLCCVVIGLPDEDLGQRVHAIVQCERALDTGELRTFLRERLSRYKIPRSVEFVREPLRNDAGKVRRGALRAERMAQPAAGPPGNVVRTLCLLCALWLGGGQDSALAAPRAAPAISAPELFSGDTLELAQFRGRFVLLEFWASWCGPCWRSFPLLDELQARYGERGLVILAVSVDEDVARAREFAQRKKARFTLLQDPSGSIADRYAVDAMPHAFLIDPAGAIVQEFVGFNEDTEARLLAALRARLDRGG